MQAGQGLIDVELVDFHDGRVGTRRAEVAGASMPL
jgi:hypothetical protein